MNRFVSILVMLFAFLFGTSGSVLGANNHSSPEVLSGNFLLWEAEVSAEWPLELANPTREVGVWVYDEALGVPVYVKQNPWTYYDPLGLYGWNDFKGHVGAGARFYGGHLKGVGKAALGTAKDHEKDHEKYLSLFMPFYDPFL